MSTPTETYPEVEKRPLPIFELAGVLMVLAAMLLLVRELSVYKTKPHVLPAGSKINEVPVEGMSVADAEAHVQGMYRTPITVFYAEQAITLDPAQVDVQVEFTESLASAEQQGSSISLPKFWNYIWLRNDPPVTAQARVTYSQEKLREWLQAAASQYDREAQLADAPVINASVPEGQAGRHLDIEASLPLVEAALKSTTPAERTASLVIRDEAPPEAAQPALATVQDQVVQYLLQHQFRGVISLYLIDETSGEELHMELDLRTGQPQYLNCEVAYAGLSTMKVPITVDYFRYLDWEPYPYEEDVIKKVLTESSNILSNYMLGEIGLQDQKRGAYEVTDSMHYLGLENTFIAAPYDDESEPEYFTTPAREAARAGTCVNTNPDIYMQTTAADVAQLLDMVYQCAEFNGGDLIAAYPDDITPLECQEILDTMKQNVEGKLIRSGLPVDMPLAHKHGYTYDTISDSGVIFGPSGDYVLTMWIWEDVDWVATGAYPIMRDISSLIFTYFNPDMANVPRMGYGDLLETGETP